MSHLLDRVRDRLATAEPGRSLDQLMVEESDLVLDSRTRAQLSQEVTAELRGAGPLESLLALPDVTDVLVNGPHDVWLDRGTGLERTAVRFAGEADVRRLAARLASQAGRRLDDAAPFVDAVLPDGTRLHAILPPLVPATTLSLRVLARRSLSLADLVALGALHPDVAGLLQAAFAAQLTTVISGGTGSGKTTLLAALLATVDRSERIVTVEDAAELAVAHPHVVALVARTANVERSGAIGPAELVRQALRMRADRLVVGEFRGPEIVELLGALNTGHSGGAATVHANSVADVPARLVALASMAGMSPDTLRVQAASAIDLLVHIRRDRTAGRRVEQIALWPAGRDGHEPRLVWTRAEGLQPGAQLLARRWDRGAVELPALLTGCAP